MLQRGNRLAGPDSISKISAEHTLRLVIQAYTKLMFIPEREGGLKFSSLTRFGAYEVRMFELSSDHPSPDFPIVWVELYSHEAMATLDSFGRSNLDEAGTAAQELIAAAWEYHAQTTAMEFSSGLWPDRRRRKRV